MQFVRVHVSRGWIVLASDVTHYYENMETGRPFSAAFNVGDMLEAYDALRANAPSRITWSPATTRWSCGNTRRRGRSSKAWWPASM